MFTKSRKAERCTNMLKLAFYCFSVTNKDMYEDINILDTQYFVLLDTTSGAQCYRRTTRACT